MTATATLGREELADIISSKIECERDCQSYPKSCGCALDAADALLARLAAKPADEPDNGLLDIYRQNLIKECAKIAEPWPGFSLDENSTDVDRAVVAVRTEIAKTIRGLAQPTRNAAEGAGDCASHRLFSEERMLGGLKDWIKETAPPKPAPDAMQEALKYDPPGPCFRPGYEHTLNHGCGVMRSPPLTLDKLPLFADDEQIGEAVLGRNRKSEFTKLAASLEPAGLPRMNPLYRGRYVPAVKAFFEQQHSLADVTLRVQRGVQRR